MHLIQLFLSKLSKTIWNDQNKYKSYSGIILKIVKEDYLRRISYPTITKISKDRNKNAAVIRMKEEVKRKEVVEDPQYLLSKKGGKEFLMEEIYNKQRNTQDDYLSKFLNISWERIATGNGRLFLKFLSSSMEESLTLPWDLPSDLVLNQFKINLENNKKPNKHSPKLPIGAHSSALNIFLHSILFNQKPPFIHIWQSFLLITLFLARHSTNSSG